MRVGVIGCGVISRAYVENASAFDSYEIVACADLDQAQAKALGKASGLAVVTVDELIGDPMIDVILNLTPPLAHAAVTRQALAVGKHVYTEKPLATDSAEAAALADEAERLGLRIGCAPDIFLGSAYQAGRGVIDDGAIGEPLSVSAAMLVGGQETWHPNPDIFYTDGAGPLFDMGPYYLTAIVALLGPIQRVAGFASMRHARAHDRDRAASRRELHRHHADAHERDDAARRRRHGQPDRQLRGARPVHLRCRDLRYARACCCCPIRTRSAARSGSSAAAVAGRTCRTPLEAAPTRAASGSTTWSRRSRPARPIAPPGGSGRTSSTSPASILRVGRRGADRRDLIERCSARGAARPEPGVERLIQPARNSVTVVFPGTLVAEAVPPWAAAMSAAIGRPRPLPAEERPRTKRSNT